MYCRYTNVFIQRFFLQRIREKIEVDPKKPKRLITVRGVGYKLVNDG